MTNSYWTKPKDPYLVVGGHHIGDDVLVQIDGTLFAGRVQGEEAGLYIKVMLCNGYAYNAVAGQVSRPPQPPPASQQVVS